jgi:hypothetical protein
MLNLTGNHRRVLGLALKIILAAVVILIVVGCGHGGGSY